MKLMKHQQAAFFKAQEEVGKALRPYGARCVGQYLEESKNGVIETFTVYSKEADAFEGRHRLRGVITVWYGLPFNARSEQTCSVNISMDVHMAGCKGRTFEEIMAWAVPALPPDPEALSIDKP